MDPQKLLDPGQLSQLSRLFLEYGPYFLGLALLILGITLLWAGRGRRDVGIVGIVTLLLAAAVVVFALRDWSETRSLARRVMAEAERQAEMIREEARKAGREEAAREIAEERARLAQERQAVERRMAELERLKDALQDQAPFVHLEFQVADLPEISTILLPPDLADRNFRVVYQLDRLAGRFVVVIFGPEPLRRDSLHVMFIRFANAARPDVLCLSDLAEALAVEIVREPFLTPTGGREMLTVTYGFRRDGSRFPLRCG